MAKRLLGLLLVKLHHPLQFFTALMSALVPVPMHTLGIQTEARVIFQKVYAERTDFFQVSWPTTSPGKCCSHLVPMWMVVAAIAITASSFFFSSSSYSIPILKKTPEPLVYPGWQLTSGKGFQAVHPTSLRAAKKHPSPEESWVFRHIPCLPISFWLA